MTDPNYRDALTGVVSNVDWNAARVPTEPVADDHVPDDVLEEDHTPDEDDALVLEHGDDLDELNDDGSVDKGVVGDGAYVPAAWWNV